MFKQPVQQWENVINGNHYRFLCEQEKAFTYSISTNAGTDHEASTTVKGRFISMMFGFDEPFELDGMDMRLVAARGGMDIAYDGHFLISGKPYFPRPAWVWIFVVLCISLVLMGGLLGGVFGFIGSAVCIAVSRSAAPTFMRIGVCVFVTILTWAALLAISASLYGPPMMS